LLIQESVVDEVTAKLWDRMRLLRVGDPLDKNTDVGAINSAEQLERIEALVAAGEEEGAVRRTVACDLPERGWWFAPTIFTDVPRASRKDVRDAMSAARKAAGPWAARTAYNRGQILYRAAEALESRGDALAKPDEMAAAVDVLVHYAGWTDKLPAVLGGVNPVAMPFLSFSLPEPTGVVGVVAPDEPPLLGLVAEIAPALAAGNTVVAVISERWPLPA